MSRPVTKYEPVKVHPFTNVNSGLNECDWCTKPDYHVNHKVDPMTGGQALLTGMLLGSIMRLNADADITMIHDVRPLVDDKGNYLNHLMIETVGGECFRIVVEPYQYDAE